MSTKLGLYFSAGYPQLDSNLPILNGLSDAGVDFIEVGVPFSDPLADGPVIQESSKQALLNGITLERIFEDLLQFVKQRKEHPDLYLMGYLNSFLSFGISKALKLCQEIGVKGLILPDLPFDYYKKHYKASFLMHGVRPVFLISPDSEASYIEELANDDLAFIYVLSQNATTGKTVDFVSENQAYYEACKNIKGHTPRYLGFGISSKQDIENVKSYFDGVIIGSAFIRRLDGAINREIPKLCRDFLDGVR